MIWWIRSANAPSIMPANAPLKWSASASMKTATLWTIRTLNGALMKQPATSYEASSRTGGGRSAWARNVFPPVWQRLHHVLRYRGQLDSIWYGGYAHSTMQLREHHV